jgi:pimeloyl-ACP methyl ester carboxylesterase
MKPHLLLLPGMLSDERFWRAQVEALADICLPVVIDYGLTDRIEDMADAVLKSAPPRFAVAGHSMGGRVAQEVVRRAPQRVVKLALFCTDFRGPAQSASDWEQLSQIANTQGMRRAAETLVRDLIAPDRQKDTGLVSEIVEMIAQQTPGHLAAHIRAGRTRPDYSSLLPSIACPTLVCAGEQDSIRSVRGHEEMAARIPHSRLVVIKNCGHMVAMEQPRAVTAAMRDWLQCTTASAAIERRV